MDRKPKAIAEVVIQQAKFSVALDSDRPTEIPMVMTIYPAKNSRGKPRVDVCCRYGKAKRHDKPAAARGTPSAGPLASKRRKAP